MIFKKYQHIWPQHFSKGEDIFHAQTPNIQSLHLRLRAYSSFGFIRNYVFRNTIYIYGNRRMGCIFEIGTQTLNHAWRCLWLIFAPLNLPNSHLGCSLVTALQIPVPALFGACSRLRWLAASENRLKMGGEFTANAFSGIKAGAAWNGTTHSLLLSAWSSWLALVGLLWGAWLWCSNCSWRKRSLHITPFKNMGSALKGISTWCG